jgi:hypothetical protein
MIAKNKIALILIHFKIKMSSKPTKDGRANKISKK